MVRGIGNDYGFSEQVDYQKRMTAAKGIAELGALGAVMYGVDKFAVKKDHFRPSAESIDITKAILNNDKEMLKNWIKTPFKWVDNKLGNGTKKGIYSFIRNKAVGAKNGITGWVTGGGTVANVVKKVANFPGAVAGKAGNWILHLPKPLKAAGLIGAALITGKAIYDMGKAEGAGKAANTFAMMESIMPPPIPNIYDPEAPGYVPTIYEKFLNK